MPEGRTSERVIERFRRPDEKPGRILIDYLTAERELNVQRRTELNALLSELGYTFDVGVILTNTKYGGVRLQLIQYARARGHKI